MKSDFGHCYENLHHLQNVAMTHTGIPSLIQYNGCVKDLHPHAATQVETANIKDAMPD
jgi:hypothetical protein